MAWRACALSTSRIAARGQRHLGIDLGMGIAGMGDHEPTQQQAGFLRFVLLASELAQVVEPLRVLGLKLQQDCPPSDCR